LPASRLRKKPGEDKLSTALMEKNMEEIGLHEIMQMGKQECEETLLYLRYYLNRLQPGGPRKTYQELICQLEGRLQEITGPAKIL
jgi:hypothetical protein